MFKTFTSNRGIGILVVSAALGTLAILVFGVPCGAEERPLIGVSSTIDVENETIAVARRYVQAVWESGGLPLVLPNLHETPESVAEYATRLDGLVIIGGLDVPPEAYGEEPHESVKVMPPERWDFDRRLIAAWIESEKPILGICLGAQMMNVVLGGALIQDIPTQVGRDIIHRDANHPVNVLSGTRLAEILAEPRLDVWSNHHQAVKRTGRGIRVAARSDDGVIEATEFTSDRWGVFVQWHPSKMEEPHRRKIFGALVEASRRKDVREVAARTDQNETPSR